MILIFTFWIWSLNLSMSVATDKKADAAQEKFFENWNQLKEDAPTLWQSLGAGISNIINTAKDDLNSSPNSSPPASQENKPAIENLPME